MTQIDSHTFISWQSFTTLTVGKIQKWQLLNVWQECLMVCISWSSCFTRCICGGWWGTSFECCTWTSCRSALMKSSCGFFLSWHTCWRKLRQDQEGEAHLNNGTTPLFFWHSGYMWILFNFLPEGQVISLLQGIIKVEIHVLYQVCELLWSKLKFRFEGLNMYHVLYTEFFLKKKRLSI